MRLALLGVGVLCCAAAGGGGLYPPGSALRFRHIGTADGLASNDIHALAQDAAGYMWIATDNGLQRYDGYNFVPYVHDPRDSGSLAQNIVTALAFAPDGTLWAGTQAAGLDSLPPGSSRFHHHRHDGERAETLADDSVFALLFDRQRRLWIGTDHGLDRLDHPDSPDDPFHHFTTRSTLPNGERILSLHEDPQGRIWVGSDHGVFYYDSGRDALVKFTAGGDAAAMAVLATAPIVSFYNDHAGRLWVGSEHGIGVFDRGVLTAFHTAKPGVDCALASDHSRGLQEDDDGDLWIATLHGGLSRFDGKCFSNYRHDATDPGSLRDNEPRTLFRDRTGLYWIGSYYSGIDIYDPRTRVFGYYHARPGTADGLASNMVTSVYKQADGTVWVATLKGLTRLDAQRRHYRQYILPGRPSLTQDDTAVNAVYGDREGRLWAGTDYGLARYQPATDSFQFYRLVGTGGDPYESSVSDILEDSAGRLWVGTEAGLVRFDPARGAVAQRFLPDARRDDALPSGGVDDLCESRDGVLWVASLQGLARFDGVHDHFLSYTEGEDARHSLSSNTVLSCAGGRDGRVWVGTDNGLDVLDPRNGLLRRFGLHDGLANLDIAEILEDRGGELWLATDKGITHFSPKHGVVRNYAESDGLQQGEFNAGAGFAAADGELFFGGSNGFNSFYPEALGARAGAPGVAITGLSVLGQPRGFAPDQTVALRYRDNILGFGFAAFDYAEPAHNRFRYRLEGFDDDWRETAPGEHVATYTNLDPGRYRLRLQASNDGLHWSSQEATLAIDVRPPPWRSAWAYLGYLAALALVGGGGFYLFARSLRRRQAYADERNRRRWAEALHQLIQSVIALEDEHAIVACLLDSLMNFIDYDRALFYSERDTGLALVGCRGGDAVEQLYHERWPAAHAPLVAALHRDLKPRMLSEAEAATLEMPGRPPRHYLAVPLASATSPYRLLLVGRTSKTIQSQGLDIAAAMAKQVSVALDRALLIRDLEKLATTDSLTRLSIRRSFLQRAEAEFDRSRRYQRPLSVLMLDVDHFKKVNDSYGHEIGDQVLRTLADTCRAGLRLQDVMGRYGGEEFIAILPETSEEIAREVAERLRHSVEAMTVSSAQGLVKVSVSIGVATVSRATLNIGALINAADRALYAAKQKGRNRVETAL